mmetsp:Transcript_6826/g.10046  ORF Transcript_6826/g.10046 Transcript_6826/m.10046 type:complete len:638 (+) Transcript_6826:263-2176(+)
MMNNIIHIKTAPEVTSASLPHHKHNDSNDNKSDYEELLCTITELQSDLQNTISLASSLQAENACLVKSHDETKLTLDRTKERYEKTRKSLLKQLEIASKKENQLEEKELKWRQEIDVRRKELEIMKDEFKVHDDREVLLRAQVVQEMRDCHTEKVNQLENNNNQWREKFFKANKELEISRAELEQVTTNAKNSMDSTRKAWKNEVAALNQTLINVVRGEEEDGKGSLTSGKKESLSVTIRRLNISLGEKTILEENLRQEIEEINKALEEKQNEHIHFATSKQSELAETLNQCALMETDNHMLRRKVARLEEHNKELNKKQVEADKITADVEKRVVYYKQKLDCAEKKLGAESEQLKKELERSVSAFSEERAELTNQIDSWKKKLRAVEQRTREVQDHALLHMKNSFAEHEMTTNKARKELKKVQDENLNFQREQCRLKDEMKILLTDHASAIQKLMHACESCRFESTLITREKDALVKKLMDTENKMEGMKKQVDSSKKDAKDANDKIKKLSEELERSQQHHQDAKDSNKLLQQKFDSICREFNQMKTDVDKKNQRYLSEISIVKKQQGQKEMKIMEKYKEEIKELEAKLSKEKKRGEIYKQKALAAHQKNVRAKEALEFLTSPSKEYQRCQRGREV